MTFDMIDIKIIRYLLDKKEWDSINQIIDELKISRSILDYHLRHINQFLTAHKLTNIYLTDKNILDNEKITNIFNKYIRKNKYLFLNSNNRRIIISIFLIFNNYTSLSTLADFLFVSKLTIYNDINKINEDLNFYNFKSVKLVSSKNGYSILGNIFDIHNLFANQVVTFINNDNSNLLINFLINNLKFDDYGILEQSNLTHQKLYENICLSVDELYENVKYIELQKKSMTLILLFLHIKKIDYNIKGEEEIKYINYEQKLKTSLWYYHSTKIFNNIEKSICISFKIGLFEKIHVAYLISSYLTINIEDIDANDIIIAKTIVNRFDTFFIKNGFTLFDKDENNLFYKFILWIITSPFSKVFFDKQINEKIKIYRKKQHDQIYLKKFSEIFMMISQEYNLEYNKVFSHMIDLYYTSVNTIPYLYIESNEIVLITKSKGAQITNTYLALKNILGKQKDIQIVSIYWYKKNIEKFKDKYLITDVLDYDGIKTKFKDNKFFFNN
ncbi:HTH domain-containing protein [Spiroplasma endosymbiont of Aspidapion aeneum]|uniref:HTH domain-containing protein n=1 Tax=Spiroplasma endosymbiont of Aspidapion aeneum TaxID=3066276 RepID=UPI00313BEDAD